MNMLVLDHFKSCLFGFMFLVLAAFDENVKGATKSYQKIIFVSATKIDENTTNILNCFFELNSCLGPSN